MRGFPCAVASPAALVFLCPVFLAGCPMVLGIDHTYAEADAGARTDAQRDAARRDGSPTADARHAADAKRGDSGSGCDIAGARYAPGAANPTNHCEICEPTSSTTSWASAADGMSCGNGQTCTGGKCGTECLIAGKVYASSAANPSDACESCQPGTSTTAWSNAADGTGCGSGEVCRTGTCSAGCDVAGAFYTPTAANPSNACVSCQPSVSTTMWSNVADGTSCGSVEVCSAGICGCPAASPTEISGVVMDPGENVPLMNAAVYVSTGTPIALTDEPANASAGAAPACDKCASLSSPGYLTGVATDVNGKFTLPVSPGTYTVVAQIGRWRRIAPNVTASACTNTVIPTNLIRMPASRSEGDIPKMAVVEGALESVECWLAKIGIDTSEFAPYVAGAPNRIQLYNSANAAGVGENYWNGVTDVVPPPAIQLWGSGALNTLNDYSALLMGCDGVATITAAAAAQTAMVNYANGGGRLFLDHLPGETWMALATTAAPTIPGTGWSGPTVATWNTAAATPPAGTVWEGTVLDTTPEQQAMYGWLAAWDNTPDGAGHIASSSPRAIATAVGTSSLELVSFPTQAVVDSFWLDTPTTASPGSYCGRVVFNDMHASATRSSTLTGGTTAATTFPASCSTSPLTSEELALEYEFFAMFACGIGVTTPLVP